MYLFTERDRQTNRETGREHAEWEEGQTQKERTSDSRPSTEPDEALDAETLRS